MQPGTLHTYNPPHFLPRGVLPLERLSMEENYKHEAEEICYHAQCFQHAKERNSSPKA